MVTTDLLRRQHDAALAMADRLLVLVDVFDPDQGAYPIVVQLNRLLAILRVHLAQEDLRFYPSLLASSDPQVARTAQAYIDEMGGLAAEFEFFVQHWSCSASVASSFEEFRTGVHELILALAVRIDRENNCLYPMAEADTALRQSAA